MCTREVIKYPLRFCSGKFFLLLNSCSNFLIYVMCSPKFRRLLTKELRKIFRQIPPLYHNPEYLFAVLVSYISLEFWPRHWSNIRRVILKRNLLGGLQWRRLRKVGRVQEDALQEQNQLIQWFFEFSAFARTKSIDSMFFRTFDPADKCHVLCIQWYSECW